MPLRVFVPVPPETIDEDGAEVQAIVSDPTIDSVALVWAPLAGGAERPAAMTRHGRGVWRGSLPGDGPVRYWIAVGRPAGTELARDPAGSDAWYSATRATGG
jgi:hypothetical protein